ncbi:toll/interleukin-1 receptor domain-containing protein [Mucilaginibacter endophyticus]|uniref:toll/interleukin-1 receptor domain-containing protein n=1 Tax=Mucilaginibacter endophyticus TaxID=2675003 RepID=UPI000E0D945B|nr:toll/interleukin-1 receptor domain-containing protein [Mucilaginibacter endophyticus]
MSKIFISHSSKDNDFVKRLAHDLLTNDIPVWLDAYELSLGDSLYDKIFTGIKESNYLIVVISEHYNSSIWTSKEFRAILAKEDKDRKKYLIPIKIDKSEVPLEIADRLYQNFELEYESSVKNLTRFFKREDFSIKSIPIEKRQIILNFSDYTEVDIALIRSILSDSHLHRNTSILKKQIFFNGYASIDKLLAIGKNNLLSIENNKAILEQYDKDSREIEHFVDYISKGVLLMLNEFKPNNNTQLISISIYWYVKMFMNMIYSIINRYLDKKQLKDLNIEDKKFYSLHFLSSGSFSAFYDVNGYARLDVFDKNDNKIYCSITVDEDCYAYKELKKLPIPITFSEALSHDLMYKYLIPQNVYSKIVNEHQTVLMTNFKDYLVGLS